MLQYLLGESDDPLVRLERCKMMASGCQLVAIGVLAASIVAPIFNPALTPGFFTRVGGGVAAALIELLALRIIGYISVKAAEGE